jgi:hypothetical protein
MQHITLFLALDGRLPDAARLIGYINSYYGVLGAERKATMKWGYEKLTAALHQQTERRRVRKTRSRRRRLVGGSSDRRSAAIVAACAARSERRALHNARRQRVAPAARPHRARSMNRRNGHAIGAVLCSDRRAYCPRLRHAQAGGAGATLLWLSV